MPGKIKFSEQQIIDICASYEKESTRDIAKRYQCCANTINQALVDNGVNVDNKIKHLSRKRLGKESPRKGVKLTEEQKFKISIRMRGHRRNVGRKASDETKEKMRQLWRQRLSLRTSDQLDENRKNIQIRLRMKNLLNYVLRRTHEKKWGRSSELLGYTRDELKGHIFLQWDSSIPFELDHIVPISAFLKRNINDPKIINSLVNNRNKSDKTIQGYWKV